MPAQVSLSTLIVIIIQAITAGFSALPLVGTIAKTLTNVVNIDLAGLAVFGQIFAMWVGRGTVIIFTTT